MLMKAHVRTIPLIFALVFLAYTAPACVSATAGITTSNIPLEGRKYTVLGSAETSVSWTSFEFIGLIGIPLRRPPVDEAMQELLKSKGGDALINIRYSTDNIIVFFFFNIHRFHIKADVVKIDK
ncbi:MAG: hypothetical protein HY042_09295 [Spirochaetia bacterium]|nr:hypothetical protein [Spirochaetia bacterium]